MSDIITANFDGFSFTTAPFSMNDWPYTDAPSKQTKTYRIAREHGQKRVFQSYDSDDITISGEINATSRTELDAYIDQFKAWTRRDKGTFTVDYGLGVRVRDFTVKSFKIPRQPQDLSHTPWSLTLEAESPFWTDGTSDALVTAQSITAATQDMGVNIGGTFDGYPVISLQIVAFNPTNAPKSIIIGNPATSQFLTINRTFQVGDVISVDCEQYIVAVNSSTYYASGQFPIYDIGPGLLRYSDDATSRTVSITATNERRYL